MTHGDHDHHHHHHVHGPVGGGPAVLDIGGDVGALVATMDEDAIGTELFLRPSSGVPASVHTGVWHRDLGTGAVTVAVFPELAEDVYEVLGEDGRAVETVAVRGGAVATIDLRSPSSATQ